MVYLPVGIKLLVLIILSVTIFLMVLAGKMELHLVKFTNPSIFFIGSMWLLPYVSTVIFMPLIKIREGLLKIFDQGWLEQLGGQGLIKKASQYSAPVDYFISRGVKTYL